MTESCQLGKKIDIDMFTFYFFLQWVINWIETEV